MPTACAGGRPRPCRSSLAFISSTTSVRPWKPSCSITDRRFGPPRSGRPWRSRRPLAWCPSHPCIRDGAGASSPSSRRSSGRPGTPAGPPSARVLTPYVPSLIRRWRESGADSRQLWREIQTLGYTSSARTVGRCITRRRRAADAGHPPESQRSPYMRPQGPSARAVSFVMVRPAAKRSREAQTSLDQLCQMDTGIARAHGLTHAFLAMGRERRGADLEAWMAEALSSGIAELVRFAHGLQDDLSAIKAGLILEWSSGVTEGHIHRLKLVKRQSYGRAGFALIRQRVLQAA